MAASSLSPTPARRECDLFAPIAAYLCAHGYTVRAEVKNCDITAVKNDELIIIELKKGFSTDLLIQATQRQRIADTVYVALPVEGAAQRRERYAARWRGIEHLLKRLEIGLILVSFPSDTDAPPLVEVVFHPITEHKIRRSPKTRRAILREIAGRSGNYNTGGATKRPLVTAYREQALFIACCLARFGPLAPADLRARCGTAPNTQNILYKNVYDWFERQERGVYALRKGARETICADYAPLVAHFQQKISEVTSGSMVVSPPTPQWGEERA